MKTSKKYAESLKLIDQTKTYDAKEALKVLTELPKAKFDETV